MKIINPNDTEHTIELIPRFYGGLFHTLHLYNEVDRTEYEGFINQFSVSNGVYTLVFEIDGYTAKENDTFNLKLIDGSQNKIQYFQKVLATTQDTQNYKLTDGLYTYD